MRSETPVQSLVLWFSQPYKMELTDSPWTSHGWLLVPNHCETRLQTLAWTGAMITYSMCAQPISATCRAREARR